MRRDAHALGDLAVEDPDRARAWIERVLREQGGNVRRTARTIGMSRRHLYRLIYRLNMEVTVAQCRRLPKEGPETVVRARAVLEEMSK